MLTLLLFLGCSHLVVRDASTYESEVNWFAASLSQSAAALEEAAKSALDVGDREQCLEYAELALVLGVRGPYHAAKALFLADLGGDPGDPPPIPEASTFCPEPATPIPEPEDPAIQE